MGCVFIVESALRSFSTRVCLNFASESNVSGKTDGGRGIEQRHSMGDHFSYQIKASHSPVNVPVSRLSIPRK